MAKCLTCKTELSSSRRKFCSCKCAQSNPATKEKQRAAKLGRHMPWMLDERNPAKSLEARAKISCKLRGNQHTRGMRYGEETRQRMSRAASLSWKRDPGRKLRQHIPYMYKFASGRFYSSKNHKSLFYRSSYELLAMKKLERMKRVVSYEVEPLLIPYRQSGKRRHYIPDFKVTSTSNKIHLIEVKPARLISRMRYKEPAARKFAARRGWSFRIWTEVELGIA